MMNVATMSKDGPDALAILGSICLGTVIGWLLRFFVQRHEGHFTFRVFIGVISVVTGGVVIRILASFSAYCIGLLIGVVAFPWINAGDRILPAPAPPKPDQPH